MLNNIGVLKNLGNRSTALFIEIADINGCGWLFKGCLYNFVLSFHFHFLIPEKYPIELLYYFRCYKEFFFFHTWY